MTLLFFPLENTLNEKVLMISTADFRANEKKAPERHLFLQHAILLFFWKQTASLSKLSLCQSENKVNVIFFS